MSVSEFGLIQRFFAGYPLRNPLNKLGIGDDCALLQVPDGCQLAVTTDTMVEGVHFFADVDPASLGHKLLAVNLSDLASMGAQPFAVTLALTLPKVDEVWLDAFAGGLMDLAQRYTVDLIGGDTTSGPLTLTIQAMGWLPSGRALRRSTAQVGDNIYVTGELGNAGLGLKIKTGFACPNPEQALAALHKPLPRIDDGLFLRDKAHACIDLSDGLASDLRHILQKSGVGARLNWADLPLSAAVRAYIADTGDWLLPLTGGDDYELCFTAAPTCHAQLAERYRCIGVIESVPGLRMVRDGQVSTLQAKGFEHFS